MAQIDHFTIEAVRRLGEGPILAFRLIGWEIDDETKARSVCEIHELDANIHTPRTIARHFVDNEHHWFADDVNFILPNGMAPLRPAITNLKTKVLKVLEFHLAQQGG